MSEIGSLAERLERERRTPSSHRTPSGPRTPADNVFAPPMHWRTHSPRTVLRAVASAHLPREEMHLGVEGFAMHAGLPPGCFTIRGPAPSTLRATPALPRAALALLDCIRLGDGKIPNPDGGAVQVSLFPSRLLADMARRIETHSAVRPRTAPISHDH